MKTGNLAATWLRKASDHGDELKEVIISGGMKPVVDHIKHLEDKFVALEKENSQLRFPLSQARPSLNILAQKMGIEVNLFEVSNSCDRDILSRYTVQLTVHINQSVLSVWKQIMVFILTGMQMLQNEKHLMKFWQGPCQILQPQRASIGKLEK